MALFKRLEFISFVEMKKIVAELIFYVDSASLKPHLLRCGRHFDHPKIEHLFKPRLLSRGGASIFLFKRLQSSGNWYFFILESSFIKA